MVRRLAKLAAAGLCLVLFAGWMQDLHPAFDSFSHFRHVAAALLIVCAIALALTARWIWSAGCAAIVAVTLWLSAPYFPWKQLTPAVSTADTIRILQFNLLFNSTRVEELAEAIRSSNAEVALLQEVTRTNIEVLSLLKDDYPYQLECSTYSVGSVAMLSRFPLAEGEDPVCNRSGGFLSARLAIGDRQLTVANLHSKWPWPGSQKRQLTRLSDGFAGLASPAVLAGDFNAAPWSAAVQSVSQKTGLIVVPGLKLTWRPRFRGSDFTTPAFLSLDQIMASPDLTPVRRSVISNSVSDHLPIVTEFAWSN